MYIILALMLIWLAFVIYGAIIGKPVPGKLSAIAAFIFIMIIMSRAYAWDAQGNPETEAEALLDFAIELQKPVPTQKPEYETYCWQQADGQIFCDTKRN